MQREEEKPFWLVAIFHVIGLVYNAAFVCLVIYIYSTHANPCEKCCEPQTQTRTLQVTP